MASDEKEGLDDLRPLYSIDRIIHEPARLMILAHLYVVESADFLFLTRQTGLTAGNLSSHLSKLETAGYVSIKKEFVGRKPHTVFSLTDSGRDAFKTYRQRLEQIVDQLPK